ncbi:MAG: SOS response-associated peptidase [Hyphomicrobiales bacterium]|nr:SOS response-associated peptidase [Hyphomicrobiales bacterium]
MCGRFTQKGKDLPGLETVDGDASVEHRPRYNGAPSQDFRVIRRHPATGEYRSDRLIWGLIPHWVKEENGGRRPINARSETIAKLPSFRSAYARRRCIVPVNNFFEWRRSRPPKTPYAIGMKDGSPFGFAGIWESWTHPVTGELIRTFCVLTCPANKLIGEIHDRMPVILPLAAYDRWLSPVEPDPHDLLKPYPPELMRMWAVSAKVNSPRNDTPDILAPADDD